MDELVSSNEIIDSGGSLGDKVKMQKEKSEQREDAPNNARARQRKPAGGSNNVRYLGQVEGSHPATIVYSKLRRISPRINSRSHRSTLGTVLSVNPRLYVTRPGWTSHCRGQHPPVPILHPGPDSSILTHLLMPFA